MKPSQTHLSPLALFQGWEGHSPLKILTPDGHPRRYIALFHHPQGEKSYLISALRDYRDENGNITSQECLAVQISPERAEGIQNKTISLRFAYTHPEWDVAVKVTLGDAKVTRVEFLHPAYLSEKDLPDP